MAKLALITILLMLLAVISRIGWADQKLATEENIGIPTRNKRFILFGEDVVPHEFPWIVYYVVKISNGAIVECSGSLISPRIVLTTAGCLRGGNLTAVNATIYPGWHKYPPKAIKSSMPQETGLVLTATEFAYPPLPKQYEDYKYYSYGAIILSKPLKRSKTVDFIPFASERSPHIQELLCYMAGFGFVYGNRSYYALPDVLQKLRYKMIPVKRCFEKGREYMIKVMHATEQQADAIIEKMKKMKGSQLCGIPFRGTNGSGAGTGDAGAPLMCRSRSEPWVLYGMMSKALGDDVQYVMFSRVAVVSGWLKRIVSKYDPEFQSEFVTAPATQAVPSGYHHRAVELRINGNRQIKWNLDMFVGMNGKGNK